MTIRYRINSRVRFTLFVILAIILLTTLANLVLGLDIASSSTVTEYTQVEISSGDTLWSIADTYMSDHSDIRAAVYELCEINKIDASGLQAGMTIKVPIN